MANWTEATEAKWAVLATFHLAGGWLEPGLGLRGAGGVSVPFGAAAVTAIVRGEAGSRRAGERGCLSRAPSLGGPLAGDAIIAGG